MPQTITVTGGFGGAVTVDLADSLKQLGSASFLLALVPVGQEDPPAVGAAEWKVAEADSTDRAAEVSSWVDSTQATGYYNVAADVVSDGKHQVVWVADRRDRRRRALVVVT